MAKKTYTGPQKLCLQRINDVAAELTETNEFTLAEALGGATNWSSPLGDTTDFINRGGFRGNSGKFYVVAESDKAELWLRDFIVQLEKGNQQVTPTNSYYRQDPPTTLVETLAVDWPGLRSTYKEVFKESLRSKEDFTCINAEDYRQMLDFLLDGQGKQLTNFSDGNLSVGSYGSTTFIAEKTVEGWLKSLTVTDVEGGREAYAPLEDTKATIFTTDDYQRDGSLLVYVQAQRDESLDVLVSTYEDKIVACKNVTSEAELEAILNKHTQGSRGGPSFHYAEGGESNRRGNQHTNISFRSKLAKAPITQRKVYSGVKDYSSVTALKKRATEIKIKGRTNMPEDELLEKITTHALETKDVESITPDHGCGVFLRHASNGRRYNPNRFQQEEAEPEPDVVDDSPEALDTLNASAIIVRNDQQGYGRGESTFDAFAHSEIPALASRLPRNQGGRYSSGGGSLVAVTYPDVFTDLDEE